VRWPGVDISGLTNRVAINVAMVHSFATNGGKQDPYPLTIFWFAGSNRMLFFSG